MRLIVLTILMVLALASTKAAALTIACAVDDTKPHASRELHSVAANRAAFEKWLDENYHGYSASNHDTWSSYSFTKFVGPGASYIMISISNIHDPQIFVAELTTCNFEQDWHPFWQAFNAALDNSHFRR